MKGAAVLFGAITGGCLVAIQLRHTRSRTLLSKGQRRELSRPLDPSDKWLAGAAAAAFLLMVIFLVFG